MDSSYYCLTNWFQDALTWLSTQTNNAHFSTYCPSKNSTFIIFMQTCFIGLKLLHWYLKYCFSSCLLAFEGYVFCAGNECSGARFLTYFFLYFLTGHLLVAVHQVEKRTKKKRNGSVVPAEIVERSQGYFVFANRTCHHFFITMEI